MTENHFNELEPFLHYFIKWFLSVPSCVFNSYKAMWWIPKLMVIAYKIMFIARN